jgi:hypothetical protein
VFFHTGTGSSNISLDFAKPTSRLLHISYLHCIPHQAIQVTWRQTFFVGTSLWVCRPKEWWSSHPPNSQGRICSDRHSTIGPPVLRISECLRWIRAPLWRRTYPLEFLCADGAAYVPKATSSRASGAALVGAYGGQYSSTSKILAYGSCSRR